MPNTDWLLDGRPVQLGAYADLLPHFRPRAKFAGRVQQALDNSAQFLGEWEPDKGNLTTCTDLGTVQLTPLAIMLDDELRSQVVGGIHITHRARRPQLSPFIRLQSFPKSTLLTLEIKGSPDRPEIVRIYTPPATVTSIPPLPWMSSAEYWYSGVEGCKQFWRGASFCLTPYSVKPGSFQSKPPQWWQNIQAN